jgi:hypothetical protein
MVPENVMNLRLVYSTRAFKNVWAFRINPLGKENTSNSPNGQSKGNKQTKP